MGFCIKMDCMTLACWEAQSARRPGRLQIKLPLLLAEKHAVTNVPYLSRSCFCLDLLNAENIHASTQPNHALQKGLAHSGAIPLSCRRRNSRRSSQSSACDLCFGTLIATPCRTKQQPTLLTGHHHQCSM